MGQLWYWDIEKLRYIEILWFWDIEILRYFEIYWDIEKFKILWYWDGSCTVCWWLWPIATTCFLCHRLTERLVIRSADDKKLFLDWQMFLIAVQSCLCICAFVHLCICAVLQETQNNFLCWLTDVFIFLEIDVEIFLIKEPQWTKTFWSIDGCFRSPFALNRSWLGAKARP